MTDQPTTSGTSDGRRACARPADVGDALPYIRVKHVGGNTVGGRLDQVLDGHLAKGWSLDEYHLDALHAFRRDAPAPAAPADDRATLDLARNIVNQVLDGAVERGGYALVDMGARQRFNDIADRFVADLLAARQPTPAPTAVGVSALADALRAETSEHGSDGSTFEAVIRAWLGGDYGGPAPVDTETAEVIAERARAVSLGYGEQHDDEQGTRVLAILARHYVARALAQGNRSDLIKAAGLMLNAAASFRRLGQPLGSGEVSRG